MIRWQQCNLCNGSNVETAVFRRNSWKTNYIIALLEMKALSLIWSYLGIDLRSALMSISLNVILTRRFSIYLQLSYELSTGWHELITTAQFCEALSEGLDTLAGWFIHLFYFTIELLFTTKGKWNHLFLFNRKTSKFTFSTEDIELEQVSWCLGLLKIFYIIIIVDN